MNAKPLIALAATLLLAACAHAPSHNPMATWVPSPNFEARRPSGNVFEWKIHSCFERSDVFGLERIPHCHEINFFHA